MSLGNGDARALRVGVLGPIRVWRDEIELVPGQPRQQAILGVLASQVNRVVSRNELVDAVWGEDPPDTVVDAVYNYVAGLRRVLEPGRPRRGPGQVLASCEAGYVLRLDPLLLDAHAFETRIGEARQCVAAGEPDAALESFEAAVALWRGEVAFAGVPGPLAEAERIRLGELRISALERRAEILITLGRHADATPELAKLVHEHPLRERLAELLMRALYMGGRQAEALAVFSQAREVLVRELGIEPGAALCGLRRQILAADPGLIRPAASAATRASGSDRPVREADHAVSRLVPAQLPLQTSGFTGRTAEFHQLRGWLSAAQAEPGGSAPEVMLISGTAGVGKTALAIRFAHQVATLFPDGQLYVNLRGFGTSGAPVTAVDAVRDFVDALGAPADRVPASEQALAGLYRSMLAGKKALVLLDNARDTDQVRPLLPGAPGCLVIVTSRNALTGLVAGEGARHLGLEPLGDDAAHSLLVAHVGESRVTTEEDASRLLIRSCAGLPLALRAAAARASAEPQTTLAALAEELRDSQRRLDALSTGDATTDVRAVLSWSYAHLSDRAASLFRLLGVHPGPDISVPAAASLVGISASQALAALRELRAVHLLAEYVPGRYVSHDLLRAYAAELAAAELSPAARDTAVRRVLDYYLHMAAMSAGFLNPAMDQPEADDPPLGVPEPLTDYQEAFAWCEAERPVLVAAIRLAAGAGCDAHAWKLFVALSEFLEIRGYWHEWLAIGEFGLAAARRTGSAVALGHVHFDLGRVRVRLRDADDALVHMRVALTQFRQVGHVVGQARAHYGMAVTLASQGRYREALEHAQLALGLFRAVGVASGEARVLNGIGGIHARLGDYRQCIRYCRDSVALYRRLGDRAAEANPLDELGYAYHQIGEHAEAIACYQESVAICRRLGSAPREAYGLIRLGDACQAVGDSRAAAESWQRALTIFEELRHPDAQSVRDKLRTLNASGILQDT
jgi:DNA-binding SARP family transcriptional activator